MLSCAAKRAQTEQAEEQQLPERAQYSVHLEAQLSTQAIGPKGEISEVAAAGDASLTFDAEVGLSFARTFRDGSLSHLLVFEEATLADAARGSSHGLEGRTVELRRFPNGEILAIDLAEHIMGPGRHGEIVDVLFPAISPNPPDLGQPGATAVRLHNWPMVDDDRNGMFNQLALEWTHAGLVQRGTDELFRLDYTGSWTGDGRDIVGGHEVDLDLEGTAQGSLLLSRADLRLVSHELRWSREVTWKHPEGVTVTQTTDFEGEVSTP